MELLKKTILPYFVFSLLLLMAFVPIFYITLKKIIVQNIDENLIEAKTRIIPGIQTAISKNMMPTFSYFDYDITLHKSHPSIPKDSIYTAELMDSFSSALIPQRFLTSGIYINQEFYSIQIRTSLADRYLLIKKIALIMASLLIALLLGIFMLNRFLSKHIWKPFYSTLERLRTYRVDLHTQLMLDKSSVKEFNDLNHTIQQLTQRDRQAYQSQKEFTENASHEMQSPLAVFQSKLELLMQTKPINEEQAILISELANESKRMARLNKSLILLTKIENNQFLEKEFVSIKDVINKILDQYTFQAKQKGISIATALESETLVNANKTLIEMLVSNLISNAIRHTNKDGNIEIYFKQKELTVKNAGQNFALNTSKIYQRFHKESSDEGSLGLGLEIVRKICDLNQYVIQYSYENNLHVFSVKFDLVQK